MEGSRDGPARWQFQAWTQRGQCFQNGTSSKKEQEETWKPRRCEIGRSESLGQLKCVCCLGGRQRWEEVWRRTGKEWPTYLPNICQRLQATVFEKTFGLEEVANISLSSRSPKG
jgi:hypothetical protein